MSRATWPLSFFLMREYFLHVLTSSARILKTATLDITAEQNHSSSPSLHTEQLGNNSRDRKVVRLSTGVLHQKVTRIATERSPVFFMTDRSHETVHVTAIRTTLNL